MFYGYTHLQPATSQPTLSGGISAFPPGQPIYLIPATALPANYGQPLTINQYRTSQPRLTRTQPRNVRARSRISEPDPNDNICLKCCVGIFVILIVSAVTFTFVLINMHLGKS